MGYCGEPNGRRLLLGLRLAWGPTGRWEGFVVFDGWIGASEPAEPLQFANLNEVSDDGDIFKKNIKME